MIIEMYGKCDNYEITFTQNAAGLWEAGVPADYEDGQYVVEIWALDITGLIIYWTGILYMYDGKVVFLQLAEDPYRVIIGTSEDEITAGTTTDDIELLTSSFICKVVMI